MMEIQTAASFFTGIAGLDLAAVSAFNGKLDIRYMCEIDPFCRSVLRKHAPTYWQGS